MNLYEFLLTAPGVELTNALVLLITAVASYFAFLAHRSATANSDRITGYLADDEARRRAPPDQDAGHP